MIGNSGYKHAPLLVNPTNDATDIVKILSGLGFQVTKGLDLNKTEMDRALNGFAASLKGAEVGLFFYAGHGLQVSGQNYLVPVDAKLDSSSSLEFEAVRLDVIQRIMENETQTNVLILDACRDNPLTRNLARAMGTRSGTIGKGLAAQESGAGTIISYSTQPGNVAFDGLGARNSPFAGALVKYLPSEGRDLSSILVKVRNDVMAATGKRQVPWEHSALTEELVLTRGSTVAALPATRVEQSAEASAPRAVEANTSASDSAPAMTKTAELAAAKPETITKTALTSSGEVFLDTFDGDALGKHWEVQNEDRDAYIVENGALLLLTNKKGGVVTATNAMHLTGIDLEGDWDISLDFRADFLEGGWLQLGLVGDGSSPLRALIGRRDDTNCKRLSLTVTRSGNQEVTNETYVLQNGSTCHAPASDQEFSKLLSELKTKRGVFTLTKRGRSYQAKFKMAGLQKEVITKEVIILQASGRPAFALGINDDAGKQVSAHVDEFRIKRGK